MRTYTEDEVEWHDDAALFEGEPIDGYLLAYHPNESLAFEGMYRGGLPDGLQQHWHPNGQLMRQSIAIRGHGSAGSMLWYSSGLPQERIYSRYGFVCRRISWGPDGRLASDVKHTPSDTMQRFIDSSHAKMGFTDWLDGEDDYPIPSARLST